MKKNYGFSIALLFCLFTITSESQNTLTPLVIKGPNSPASSAGAQDINYSFLSAGSARIRAYRGGAWGTYLQFLTNSTTATGDNPQVAMHIDANGLVGIGTIAPAYPLDVNGIGQFAGGAKIGNGPVGFYGDGLNHAVRAFNTTNTGGFWIQSSSGINTYMYVGQTGNYVGNVGIGTTTPNARLSFGTTNVGLPAIHLYDGPATNRFGLGIQNAEMQMFVGINGHFSWNSGGDLQVSGTNEVMRLTTAGNLGVISKVGIGTVNPLVPLDIDTKTEWVSASYLRLMGSTYEPQNYNLTIKKVETGGAPGNHPTFDYNFDHYQFGGINNTQLSLTSTGSVGIGGGLTIRDNVGYLVGGSINPGIDGLVANGGNKFTINAGTAVRVNAPLLQARMVKVTITAGDWADYVFASGYHLLSLTSVEKFINKYKHLPEVPSAEQVEKNDLDIGATQALLLKKIEELTLYMIEQDKKITSQQKMLGSLKKEIQNKANKSIN